MKDFGLTKSQIIQLSRTYLFKPQKRLGQNFLIDKNIINKIITVVEAREKDIFMEIGAGLGALTIPLAQRASSIVAFEIDRKLYRILQERTDEFKNITVKHQDFLKINFDDFTSGRKIRIIGNLPYYITSLIIEKLVEEKERIEDIHIMTQKEYAHRLTATPAAGKEYSSITLFVNYYFLVEKLFLVKKTCFWPEPEVDSVFLRLKKRSAPAVIVKDEKLMFSIIRSAFGKRRKTILNSLSFNKQCHLKKEQWGLVFGEAGILPTARAEELTLKDFARLTNVISRLL